MMHTGYMYIVLLFKAGDPRDLANWRPVTKVPRALSIMESELKLRLFPLMGLITAPDQMSAAIRVHVGPTFSVNGASS